MGITEALYACIADAVTVYSGKDRIDRRFAPMLLKKKESASPAGTPQGAASAAAVSATISVPQTVSPLTFESVAGKAVTVRLVSEGGGPIIRSQKQILRITEDLGMPYRVLSRLQSVGAPTGKGSACVVSPQQVAADE